MIRAYELARAVGDTERVECHGSFVREGGDYLVDLQYTEDQRSVAGISSKAASRPLPLR